MTRAFSTGFMVLLLEHLLLQWPWSLHGCFSHFFLTPCLCGVFCPFFFFFLQMLSQKCCLLGSRALLCLSLGPLQSAGAGCVQRGSVPASPYIEAQQQPLSSPELLHPVLISITKRETNQSGITFSIIHIRQMLMALLSWWLVFFSSLLVSSTTAIKFCHRSFLHFCVFDHFSLVMISVIGIEMLSISSWI